MTPEMETCIRDSLDCYRVCLETKNYCMSVGGKHSEAAYIRLLSDCLEICSMNAHFMIKHSQFGSRISAMCTDVCKQCADSCEMFTNDDQMKLCAQMCRKCEQSCRVMAG